jgi:hypothetical protein
MAKKIKHARRPSRSREDITRRQFLRTTGIGAAAAGAAATGFGTMVKGMSTSLSRDVSLPPFPHYAWYDESTNLTVAVEFYEGALDGFYMIEDFLRFKDLGTPTLTNALDITLPTAGTEIGPPHFPKLPEIVSAKGDDVLVRVHEGNVAAEYLKIFTLAYPDFEYLKQSVIGEGLVTARVKGRDMWAMHFDAYGLVELGEYERDVDSWAWISAGEASLMSQFNTSGYVAPMVKLRRR